MSSRPLLRPLCDPYPILLEKSELFLAVVNRWAAREGHERLVQEKVGIGKLAAIVGLAARSLLPDTPTHSLETLQRKSGLSPAAYKTALDHLQAAIDDHNKRQSAPRTPRKDYRSLSSPSYSASYSPRSGGTLSTPAGLSLKEKAQAVQSGAAFGLASGSSPRTPHSHRSSTGISPFRSPAGTPQGRLARAAGNTPLASPSTSRLKEAPGTPSSSLRRFAQDSTPGDVSRTSTPKSVRFEAGVGRRRQLAADEEEDGEQTPSKRRRMSVQARDPEDQEDAIMASPSSSVARSRRNGSAVGDDLTESRTPGRRDEAGRRDARRAMKDAALNDDLPFVLFPLSVNMRSRQKSMEIEEGQKLIKQWLHVWKDWLSDDLAEDRTLVT